jgi:CheY-like chemotaxis protein
MPEKILIVDDEQDGVSFISSVLDDNGYDHISANNGNTGLELARSEKPDLILLDLIMPEKSGIMMFQELKKDSELREIPIVIVSGASEVTGVDFKNFIFKQASRKGGAPESEASEPAHYFTPDGFVEKPIDPEELIRAIQTALKK